MTLRKMSKRSRTTIEQVVSLSLPVEAVLVAEPEVTVLTNANPYHRQNPVEINVKGKTD